MTSLAALFESTESVFGIPAANDEVPTINHPANARKNTLLMATLLSTSTQ
jgi:hypothetical protein